MPLLWQIRPYTCIQAMTADCVTLCALGVGRRGTLQKYVAQVGGKAARWVSMKEVSLASSSLYREC